MTAASGLQKAQLQIRSWIAIEVTAVLSMAAEPPCLAVLFIEQKVLDSS